MREENLEPAPRSWVEKAYELGSLHVLSAALILLSAFHPLSTILGQGPALAILIPATTALTGLISLPVISAQSMKRRQRFLSNRLLFGSPRGVVIGNHEHLAFKEAQCLLTGQ